MLMLPPSTTELETYTEYGGTNDADVGLAGVRTLGMLSEGGCGVRGRSGRERLGGRMDVAVVVQRVVVWKPGWETGGCSSGSRYGGV